MVLKCVICFVIGGMVGLIVTSLTTIASMTSYKEEERERFERAFENQRDILNNNIEKFREQKVESVVLEDLFEGTIFEIKKEVKQ